MEDAFPALSGEGLGPVSGYIVKVYYSKNVQSLTNAGKPAGYLLLIADFLTEPANFGI